MNANKVYVTRHLVSGFGNKILFFVINFQNIIIILNRKDKRILIIVETVKSLLVIFIQIFMFTKDDKGVRLNSRF